MGCTARAHSADRTFPKAKRRRGRGPRAWWSGFFALFLPLLHSGAAQAQSCAGKVAGDVCRPAAGSCDVAESCAATGGNPGAPLYPPTDGTLATDIAWASNMGYGFTPNKTITVTSLGGFFNGTRTVSLYDRTSGAVLASASVTASNSWAYVPITPVTLLKLTSYSVAVYLPGSGGASRTGMTSLPSVLADATIDGSCYRAASTAEPCAASGLLSGTNYGMADLKYLPAVPLYEPTDGTLHTDVAGDYIEGYAFTPNKNLTLTHLGGFYNGKRKVILFNRATGAVLTQTTNTSNNAWVYTKVNSITLLAGTSYTVTVTTDGSGGAYRSGMTSMPSVAADATIEGSCYRAASSSEPCAASGLISGTYYGLADIKYTPTGGGLACPADSFAPAGNVCRAAAGSCDLAESCSGASAACPANAFRPSGFSCNDGGPCTYNDVCNGAGSCGGTPITCGGGNACSTTVCNGTSSCEAAQVFCTEPPSECYNLVGNCNTGNGSCSYTVKTGAPCGTRGTCQSSGACYTPPPITGNGVPPDCATQTVPAPTPIGCDSCDPTHLCLVDSTITVPVEYQTCSGYTPRRGDIVVHEADGLTRLLVSNFGSNWTHIGIFTGPNPPGANQDKQMIRHQALNLDGLAQSILKPGIVHSALTALSFNKNWAYCDAKLSPATLFDPVEFRPGVPNTHTADMVTEVGDTGGLYWENGVHDRRQLIVAANRSLAENAASQMEGRNDYYSLNSLVDADKGMGRISNGRPGTNCASAIMSCISPTVPQTLLDAGQMRQTANQAYEAIRRQVRWMDETESAVSTCKTFLCPPFGPCPVDCNGIAWETANGIADQVIACFLFGPGSNGCDCTRDNRRWHFASWGAEAPAPPTQDDSDWLHERLTDIRYAQDQWTDEALQGQAAINVPRSYSWLPGDVLKSANYPPQNAYALIRKTNAARQYGHCYAPLTLTSTPSPATSVYGTPISWTATATGGIPASTQFALFRKPSTSSTWTPALTSPNWQSSNVLTWTPGSGDTGSWDIYLWIKDGTTPGNMNTYGYAAGYSPGGVTVTSPSVSQVYPAKGWVDGYNTQHVWGWACDPDYPTQSNRVDFWTTSGVNLGSTGAFLGSSSAIGDQCLGGTAHYFDFYPSGGIPSGTHFNAWSIDLPYATPGNDNRKCGGTGAIGDGTEFVIP